MFCSNMGNFYASVIKETFQFGKNCVSCALRQLRHDPLDFLLYIVTWEITIAPDVIHR